MLILASQSPQRKMAMEGIGIPFEVHPSEIDEYAIKDNDPLKRAVKVATAKAQTVAQKFPAAFVIAADTYVVLNNKSLEKPKDTAEAIQMLKAQQHAELTEVTGVCFIHPNKPTPYTQTVTSTFHMRQLSDSEIEQYVSNNPVTTWSAAFSPAYPAGAGLIADHNGSFTSFTYGLPVELVTTWLREIQLLK